MHYNLYFPCGAIALPKMHNDGAVEYEDGASATEAQDCLSFSLCMHLCVIYAAHTCLTMQLNIYIYIPQMGRDIVSFLSWAAEPEMEERKTGAASSLSSNFYPINKYF